MIPVPPGVKVWLATGHTVVDFHGYRMLHDDLLDQGEACCLKLVARLTRIAEIKAEIGYKHRPGI